MPLADTVDTIQGFVYVLFLVYLLCIFAYILTSWIPLPYNVWLNRVQRFLYDVVDPYLRLFRRLPPVCVLGRPQRIRVQNDTGLPASLPRNDQRVPATSDVPPNPPLEELRPARRRGGPRCR